jgi:Fe-S-cluster containining protein
LRPFFTAEEIDAAIATGLAPAHFSRPEGTQIDLVPNPVGEGYVCPAFDSATSRCRIYDVRPLDCRLYPFALMWNAAQTQVLLGWDSKCPYMRDQTSSIIIQAAEEIAQWIEQDDRAVVIARYPRLIGRFQEDVIILRPLDRVTELIGRGQAPVTTRPLTLEDREPVEAALAVSPVSREAPLAAASFAYHYIWRHRLTYSWAELHRHLCLFAESPDGIFMVLPPLGAGPFGPPFAAAFRFMRERNGVSSVTRVENVPETCTAEVSALGYRMTAKDSDYLYDAADLTDFTGDSYRSQRAACNRFMREQGGTLEVYDQRDRTACLSLFHEWSEQKQQAGADDWAHALLQDAAGAHETALSDAHALGLTGAVVRVGGRICAYTLGLWLNRSVFCVLLEVADRTIAGLAPFVFREFCRQARAKGACWINTMDDSGLSTLARSKRWYRPVRLLPNYIVTEF